MKMRALIFSALALVVLIYAQNNEESSNLSDFVSAADFAVLEQSLVSDAKAKNGVFGDAHSNFRGFLALTALSSSSVSKFKDAACKAAASDLSAAVADSKQVDLSRASDALSLNSLLSCGAAKESDVNAAVNAAKGVLNSGIPSSLHFAANIFSAAKAKVEESDLSGIIQSLVDLQKDDGSFGADGEDDGTLEAAGQSLQTLKTLSGLFKFSSADWDTISQIVDKANNLVDRTMQGIETESNIVATVQILDGLQFLAKSPVGEKITINRENIVVIADTLVSVKASPSVSEAAYVVEGIRLCTDNTFHVPVVVSVVTKAVSSGAKGQDGHVKIRVTDVNGAPIGKASVVLSSASLGDHSVLSNVALEAVKGSNDLYEFNLLANKLEHGTYSLDLSVTPDTSKKPYGELDKVRRTVRVTTTASISTIEVSVQDAKTGEGKLSQATFPGKLPDLSADYLQAIEITFAVRSTVSSKVFHPHQAFIRFSSKKSDFEAIFVTRVVDRKQKAKIVIADAAHEVFRNRGGDYEMEVVVGDAHMDEAIVWKIGTVSLTFADDGVESLTSDVKPELHHTFRQPEKRPLQVVSYLFTLLILGSFLILLGLISRLNIGLRLPSGDKFIPAVGFQLSIGGILVLYALYWLRLNMFECLSILAPLSTLAFLFGSRALS